MSKTIPIHGLLLLNKPQGITSNGILQKTKRLFQATKAGHTGSLDPLATGMLPICFGEASKFSQYLLEAKKAYRAVGLLGIQTNTGDALGEIINTNLNPRVELTALQHVLNQFKGDILQTPPMFSALKYKGRPLYKLAREGLSIERSPRSITIYDIHLVALEGLQFTIEVICSKGTYIRSLIESIGEALNMYAHLTQLHRMYSGNFMHETMYTYETLAEMDRTSLEKSLLPLETIVDYFPSLSVSPENLLALQHGKRIFCQAEPGLKRLYCSEVFYGLGEVLEGEQLKVKRLLNLTENR